MFSTNVKQKKLKFSAKINLDEVKMTYVGLSATSERSTIPVSSDSRFWS